MGQLSAEHRAVVDLTYFHEAGYREIAEILDCPVGTVKTRMMHARKHLKRWLVIASLGQLPVAMVFPFSQVYAHEVKGADPFVLGAMVTGHVVIGLGEGITAKDEIREQYCHAIDMVPTVLDALDIASQILAGWKGSRLHRRLVREVVAVVTVVAVLEINPPRIPPASVPAFWPKNL